MVKTKGLTPVTVGQTPVQRDLVAREYDGEKQIEYSIKDDVVKSDRSKNEELQQGIKEKFRSLIFPRNYPSSVSSDYTEYRKWVGVQDIFSSAINYFNTQALLTALGIAFPAPAVAAIAWMAKDCLSGVGKFLGSYLAHKVDEDPKKWNKIGKTLTHVGTITGNSLSVIPGAFLPISIAGQGIKATGETLTGASEANIEKHLAIADNIGELKAKNNNQSMITSGLGVGLALTVQVLGGVAGLGPLGIFLVNIGIAAAGIYAAHKATDTLNMNYPNARNLLNLFSSHIETGKIMTADELDKSSSFLKGLKESFSRRIRLAAGLGDLAKKPKLFREITSLFAHKNYLLYREADKTMIVLRKEATRDDVAEALYCASLLDKNIISPASRENRDGSGEAGSALVTALKRSIEMLPDMRQVIDGLKDAGWNINRIPLPPGRRAEWGY